MEWISIVSYSLLINGNSKGKIQLSRGIRQKDPLSPYIFILYIELLHGYGTINTIRKPQKSYWYSNSSKRPYNLFSYVRR